MSNYLPPRNSDGSYRDERSNTVEDAADFEHHFNSHMYDDECDDEYGEEEEDNDDCGCSDPCCPCDGSKRGTP
jgi:hypothetical protein